MIAALAGCGDGEPDPEPRSGDPEAANVAALGDSITAGSPLYDPDPAASASFGFGDDERSQYAYWATRADPGLRFLNCGVFGERTDEIAERLSRCAQGAQRVVIQGGINDIAQALGGGDAALSEAVRDAARNLDAMVSAVRAEGLEPAIVTVLPWNNGHPVADDAIAELNAGIRTIARRREVALIDFHDALEDPNALGLMGPGLTDDGDHPSIAGYRILGELVARELGRR